MAGPTRIESHKLMFEMFKHLTTLSSASALIVIAMVERLFPNPQAPGWVVAAISSFLLTLLCGLIAMWMIGLHAGKSTDEGTFPESDARIFAGASALALGCYFFGVFSTVAFAFKNFNVAWPA